MNIAFVWMRALVRFLVVSCHFPQNCVRWRRGFSLPAERSEVGKSALEGVLRHPLKQFPHRFTTPS
jgi:hypothetical protein